MVGEGGGFLMTVDVGRDVSVGVAARGAILV